MHTDMSIWSDGFYIYYGEAGVSGMFAQGKIYIGDWNSRERISLWLFRSRSGRKEPRLSCCVK